MKQHQNYQQLHHHQTVETLTDDEQQHPTLLPSQSKKQRVVSVLSTGSKHTSKPNSSRRQQQNVPKETNQVSGNRTATIESLGTRQQPNIVDIAALTNNSQSKQSQPLRTANGKKQSMMDLDHPRITAGGPSKRQGLHQTSPGDDSLFQHYTHSSQTSFSETRQLNAFKNLQDERINRKLRRHYNNNNNEHSNDQTSQVLDQILEANHHHHNHGGQRSHSRGGSNVREMIASNSQTREQEVKMFEMKFKGSLEKLDEFEREWTNFKSLNNQTTSSGGGPAVSSQQSRVTGGLSTQRDVFGGLNTIIEDDDVIDFSQSLRQMRQQTVKQEVAARRESSSHQTSRDQAIEQINYHSRSVNHQSQANQSPQVNKLFPTNLRQSQQLYQINESPRESNMQSPSSNQKDLGATRHKLFQPVKQQKASGHQTISQSYFPVTHQKSHNSSISASHQHELMNSANLCRTLKIDLNETPKNSVALSSSKFDSRNFGNPQQSQSVKQPLISNNQQTSYKTNNVIQKPQDGLINRKALQHQNQPHTATLFSQTQTIQATKKQVVQALQGKFDSSSNHIQLVSGGIAAGAGQTDRGQLNSKKEQKKSAYSIIPLTQSNNGFGRKEDLVERVMESIKTLSKKEEEIKVPPNHLTKTSKKVGGEILNFKNATSTALSKDLGLQRRRTNTITQGERPNLLQYPQSTSNKPQQNIIGDTQKQQTKMVPGNQNISKSTKVNMNQTLQEPLRSSSQTGSHLNQPGFIGNSFVRAATEKSIQEQRNHFASSKDQQISRSQKVLMNNNATPIAQPQLISVPESVEENEHILRINGLNNHPSNKINGPQKPQNHATAAKRADIVLIDDDLEDLIQSPKNKPNLLAQQKLIQPKSVANKISNHAPSSLLNSTPSTNNKPQTTSQSAAITVEINSKRTTPSAISLPHNNNSHTTTAKLKNRRQPTQTQIETSSHLVESKRMAKKVQQYGLTAKNQNEDSAQKKKAASRNIAQSVNDEVLNTEEDEKFFIQERQKKLNFHPVQEPSIDWNQVQYPQESPLPKKNRMKSQQLQSSEEHTGYNKSAEPVMQELPPQRPVHIQAQPTSQVINKPIQQFNDAPISDDEDEDENSNQIQKRLNSLLEETRRKLVNFDSYPTEQSEKLKTDDVQQQSKVSNPSSSSKYLSNKFVDNNSNNMMMMQPQQQMFYGEPQNQNMQQQQQQQYSTQTSYQISTQALQNAQYITIVNPNYRAPVQQDMVPMPALYTPIPTMSSYNQGFTQTIEYIPNQQTNEMQQSSKLLIPIQNSNFNNNDSRKQQMLGHQSFEQEQVKRGFQPQSLIIGVESQLCYPNEQQMPPPMPHPQMSGLSNFSQMKTQSRENTMSIDQPQNQQIRSGPPTTIQSHYIMSQTPNEQSLSSTGAIYGNQSVVGAAGSSYHHHRVISQQQHNQHQQQPQPYILIPHYTQQLPFAVQASAQPMPQSADRSYDLHPRYYQDLGSIDEMMNHGGSASQRNNRSSSNNRSQQQHNLSQTAVSLSSARVLNSSAYMTTAAVGTGANAQYQNQQNQQHPSSQQVLLNSHRVMMNQYNSEKRSEL